MKDFPMYIFVFLLVDFNMSFVLELDVSKCLVINTTTMPSETQTKQQFIKSKIAKQKAKYSTHIQLTFLFVLDSPPHESMLCMHPVIFDNIKTKPNHCQNMYK